jgi:hypothetical protein
VAYQMTFSSLLDDARRYLERGFSAAEDPYVYTQLPRLVNMAERRIARELKVQGFLRAVTTPLVIGQSVYQKPDRWRDTVSMRVNGLPIFARSYEYVRGYWPDDTQTGTPEFYADYNYQHWLLAPTPGAVVELEIVYYEQPQLLDEENQVNWLTAYAPNLLLYATLLEAAPFLKNDERIGTWQAAYDRAAQAISGEDLKKILDRAAIRSEV